MNQILNGLRILNTRPQNQAHTLSKNITNAGGIVIECPTIEIKATDNSWISSLPNLDDVDHAIFISANAVHHCFTQLKLNNILWPKHIQVIAIGQSSKKALVEFNISAIKIPDVPDSEHLLKINTLQEIKNQTVLLFKGEGGRQLIEEHLLQREAHVIPLIVYKRIIPKIRQQFINSLWRDDLVDIILLTSEQSITNLFKMFNKNAHYWLQEKPCLVISERLAKSASLFGIKKIILSHPHGMMNTLFDYYQGLLHDQ
jgi:uroporphyrinogen-III synthase